MPRPCKNRFVSGQPESVVYKPAGIPARSLAWVQVAMDEFETIRLLDHEGLDQEKASELMGISRPTVTRIYASARKKIAEALTEGKAISIEGGPVAESGTIPPQQGGAMGCGRGRRRGRETTNRHE
ncbi:MAG: DUF134 domain-containing protein [Planctomycetota bacterium]